jgi:hypothetical protein
VSLKSVPQPSWVAEIKGKYGDEVNFLKIFSPDKQSEYFNRGVLKCFNGAAPSLTRTRTTYGMETARMWLNIQITELCVFTAIQEKPTMAQIDMICDVIISNFGYLKVTELMVFFLKFKAGEYGKFFGVIDGLVITEALHKFMDFRKQMIEKAERMELDRQREERYRRQEENAISREEFEGIKHYFNF